MLDFSSATLVSASAPRRTGRESQQARVTTDGTRVVTASEDKTAQVWNAETGEPIASALEHQAAVRTAVFSPDGTRVVTASEDKTVRVWGAETGKPLTAPLEHRDAVRNAAFSPDGTRIVSVSDHDAARVWELRFDTGALEDWSKTAERSPIVLRGFAVVERLRLPPKPPTDQQGW